MIHDQRSNPSWIELMRVQFKSNNGKVGDENMEIGPHMMIVGDMKGLALNKNERQHGF